MTEAKTRKLTFDTALPRGTCATFTHEGEPWMAYPQSKVAALAAVIDQLLGTLDKVHDDLVRWMNAHPEDAARAAHIMAHTNQAKDLAREKAQAWTT